MLSWWLHHRHTLNHHVWVHIIAVVLNVCGTKPHRAGLESGSTPSSPLACGAACNIPEPPHPPCTAGQAPGQRPLLLAHTSLHCQPPTGGRLAILTVSSPWNILVFLQIADDLLRSSSAFKKGGNF